MKNMLDEAWGVCYYNTRFVGQAVKTPPSHGGNTGSIPVRTAEVLTRLGKNFLFYERNTQNPLKSGEKSDMITKVT